MDHVRRYDERHVRATQKQLRRASRHVCSRATANGAIPILLVGMTVAACATGPEVKTVVQETYSIEAIDGTSRQTIENFTVEDLGEARRVITPVQVQACDGPLLLYRRVKRIGEEGEEYVERHPAFETVDPFEGIYVRRLKIRNETGHTVRLNRIDAVLVDAAGNDNELMTKSALRQDLLARRSCPSTEGVIESVRSVKLLGSDIRVRPGRSTVLFAAFSGVDTRILGDWTLELNGVPVATDPGGEVLHAASFAFPLLAKGYRTTTILRKEGLFDRWEEMNRVTKEIGSGP